MTERKKRTGGEILADQLIIQGCDRLFTVPGESFLAVLDALHDRTDAIETVICRQEGGVSFMACADGAMTGQPGIAFVTRGPGATNASIGVHVAHQDSQPMILFIGDVARSDRDREGFQEVDFMQMFGPLAKWVARIDDAQRIPEYIARAYATAISGRPGPVVLVLPEDMLRDRLATPDRPKVTRPAQPVCTDAMQQMMAMLRAAQNPIAIIGGADWTQEAGKHLQSFAETMGLPIACAFRRQDAFPNDSAVYAGNLGYGPNPQLIERVKHADLILAIGARLGEATTDGYTVISPDHPGQKLIHIHPDPNELNSVYRTDLAIAADMPEFCKTAALWDDALPRFGNGVEAHQQWLQWSALQENGAALDLGACVAAMRQSCPADTIICNGAGNFSGWWHRYWPYGPMPSQLAPTAGAMGYGVPAAIAAALRFPDRNVVAVAGDGDFLMNGQELATAAQHGANLLILVIDNSGYGTIRMHQERDYPARPSGTQLSNPDFATFGKAFGAWTATIEQTDEFAPALEQAMARTGIRLLHLKTDMEYLTAGGARVSSFRKQ
ncbi:thiamine pyrophosphate-binding protein [Parasphingorhabdus sp. DH2-15]|uniref:thiamine pyrophosphate-binding protein n=1 Tax=Parasphingorhabdus sp. DH2-15 TaxID=3444112 RepID=UPI003F683ED7